MRKVSSVLGLFLYIGTAFGASAAAPESLLSSADRMIDKCIVQKCKVPLYVVQSESNDASERHTLAKHADDIRTYFTEYAKRHEMHVERYKGRVHSEYAVWNAKRFERYTVRPSGSHPGAVEIKAYELDGQWQPMEVMIVRFLEEAPEPD